MPFPVLYKTIILCSKELLAFGVLRAGTGIEGEMIFAVKFPEEFIGGLPLSRDGKTYISAYAFRGFVVHIHCRRHRMRCLEQMG